MVRKSKKQRFKAGSLGLTRVVSAASTMNAQRQAEVECSLIPAPGSGRQFGGKNTTTKNGTGIVPYAVKKQKRRRRAQGRGFHPISHPTWLG